MSTVLDAALVKRPTKAQKAAFRLRGLAIIEAAGGKLHRDADYVINTKHGELHLTVYDDWVAGRFVDPRAPVDCNPYSGKWNFHTGLDYFERRLKEVLP